MDFIYYLLPIGFVFLLVIRDSTLAKLIGESEYKYSYLLLLFLPLIPLYWNAIASGEPGNGVLFINIAYMVLFCIRVGYITFTKDGYSKNKNLNAIIILGLIVIIGAITSLNHSDSKKSAIPSALTEHRLEGSTVYATAYVQYVINSEYSAKDVLGVAYNLMTKKYKNASRLELEYGMDFTNKYGEKKKSLVGTFSPDLQELRRYKDEYSYRAGEIGEAAWIMMEFQRKGFR